MEKHSSYGELDEPATGIRSSNDDVSILNKLMTAQKDAMHMALWKASDFAQQQCSHYVENEMFEKRDDLCQTWKRLSEAERRIDELERQVRLTREWQPVSSGEQTLNDLSQKVTLFDENMFLKECLQYVTEENKLLRETLILKEMSMSLLEKEKRDLKADLDFRATIKRDIEQLANEFGFVPPTEVEIGSYKCTCGFCLSEEAS